MTIKDAVEMSPWLFLSFDIWSLVKIWPETDPWSVVII